MKAKKAVTYGLIGIGIYSVLSITNYITNFLKLEHQHYNLKEDKIELCINKIEFAFPYIQPGIFHELTIKGTNEDEWVIKKYANNYSPLEEIRKKLNPITLERLAEEYPDEFMTKKNGEFRGRFFRTDINMKSKEGIDINRMFIETDYLWRFWINQIHKSRLNRFVKKERIIPVSNK